MISVKPTDPKQVLTQSKPQQASVGSVKKKALTPEEQLIELSIRPSLGTPGKTVRLVKIMEVDESAHPGFEVQEALKFTRRKVFNVNELIATQPEVDVDKVNQLLKKSHLDPIKVIERNHRSYIIDGHHRFLAAYLKKSIKIQALAIKFEL